MAEAIGYPERMPEGALAATLRVDGAEVSAAVTGDRIVLSQRLTGEADKMPSLAGYAAGRMLREEAVLAYGDGVSFLWQDASARAGDQALVRLFESFMDSYDWWRARVEGTREEKMAGFPEMVIRP
ncbi:MAG: hypothetical protein IJ658_08400 [Kiritimatiellae bacterium]|nr:hypothetical protein [Kiritimatiellia bacterium]